jgi:hypothetical protein
MELDKGKRIANAFLSLLRYKLNCVFFIIDKKISIFYRKFYVWKILSSRGSWYLSRNGNLYNQTFQTTVYPWGGAWNIARFNIHYSGFYSQEYAKKIAFQQWYREYKTHKPIGFNHNISKSFTFIVFIVISASMLYAFYQFGSKTDKIPKEVESVFNEKQKDFGSDHRIFDRTQNNPYDEEMKKYRNAVQECDKNFSFLSKELKECESFFREKYKEIVENYYAFEESKEQKILESIKRNF